MKILVVFIAALFLCGCAFGQPRIVKFNVKAEKCKITLAQENPEGESEESEEISLGSIAEILGDKFTSVLSMLRVYPYVEIDFKGVVKISDAVGAATEAKESK